MNKSSKKEQMASNQNFVDFIIEQIEGAGEITAKKIK